MEGQVAKKLNLYPLMLRKSRNLPTLSLRLATTMQLSVFTTKQLFSTKQLIQSFMETELLP